MDILDIIRSAQGGSAIGNLANQFGIRPEQAEAVMKEIAPEFRYNLEKRTLSRGGIAELIEMMGTGRFDRYADDADALQDPATVDIGNQVLGEIMGSKTTSRAIAARAASSTGLSATLIKAMLPYFASILMGGLNRSTQGGLADILNRLPQFGGGAGGANGTTRRNITTDDGPLSMPGSQDSVRDSGKGAFPGSPLPLPGEHSLPSGRTSNPYSDIGDVLRRGGRGGSSLWTIARQVLGSALGFQSKGVIGWFIRMLVARYGWRIVKAIFGRLLGFR